MRKGLFSWAIGVVTPWALGLGLMVSFSADAGQNVLSGASRSPLDSLAAPMPADLVPRLPKISTEFGPGFGRGLLHEARLNLGAPEDLESLPDEIEPRIALKNHAKIFPEIDRRHKGDPSVGLRPTFDGKWREKNGLTKMRAAQLTFGVDASGLAAGFSPTEGKALGPDSVAAFEAWPDGESPVTQASQAAHSPTQTGSAATFRPAAIAARINQGATPNVPRALALGSTTPAELDPAADALVAAIPAQQPNVTLAARDDARPNYLASIAPENLEAEKKCLAQAIYFEARSEPLEGKAAVAQVIMNRRASGLYPATICGVVFQHRGHSRACQFSFTCEGKALRVREPEQWTQAQQIADNVLGGKTWVSEVGGATHYHADYVRPRWARALKKNDVIGRHIFYQLKPGQT